MTATVFLGPPPPEVEAVLARRRELELDGRDECWGGEYYVAPQASTEHAGLATEVLVVLRPRAKGRGLKALAEFNLGTGPADFAVPDGGVVADYTGAYAATALVVLEVLSPGDATWKKFRHYADHHVGEIVVADGQSRTVRVWQLRDDRYTEGDTCLTLELPMSELAAQIDWP